MTHHPGAPDFYTPPGHRDLYGYEIEREEAREIITYYAERGRVHAAWQEVRCEIQVHFENRPRNTEQFPNAEEEWLTVLRSLLALRREIPAIAAKAERKLAPYEREGRAAFNQTFYGEAA